MMINPALKNYIDYIECQALASGIKILVVMGGGGGYLYSLQDYCKVNQELGKYFRMNFIYLSSL